VIEVINKGEQKFSVIFLKVLSPNVLTSPYGAFVVTVVCRGVIEDCENIIY